VHRTYRWLDAPPRLFGFTFAQWVMLVMAVAAGYGCVKLLHVPGQIAVSVGVFVIGLPAALAYLSDGDQLGLGRLGRDAVAWMFSARMFDAGEDSSSRRLRCVRVEAPVDGLEGQVERETAMDKLAELFSGGRWGV
jgi:hypothetical protein